MEVKHKIKQSLKITTKPKLKKIEAQNKPSLIDISQSNDDAPIKCCYDFSIKIVWHATGWKINSWKTEYFYVVFVVHVPNE